jgi:acetolactate synthase-1/2/3 large subunit
VLHAWQDNTPCLFISGQVKRKESIRYRKNLGIRQLGVQEADIVSIVEPITKYAVMLTEPKDVLFELEKAYHTAISGRPGPVWIDVPMDVQASVVDESKLMHFVYNNTDKIKATEEELTILKDAFEKSKRPIIIAGQGIRLSGAVDLFQKFIEKHNIPFVASRLGIDVMPTTNPLFIGRIGNKGTRPGNFAVQNADFVLAMGSRLSVSSTGHEYDLFAREANIFAIDIDENEHNKQTVKIDKFIVGDIKEILSVFDINNNYCDWANRCKALKDKYPVCLPEYYETEKVNVYAFIEELSKQLKEDSAVVSDAGSAVYVTAQGIKTTSKKQRCIASGAQAEMGFTLPGAIGVCVARDGKETIGITGDGSLQMNIQELQTLAYYKFPVKLFIWNNDGYLSIRASQSKLFEV